MDSSISHALSLSPIIENIFKYLPMKQLHACAQVCLLWNNLVQIEKSRRQKIAWFFEAYQCMQHEIAHTNADDCSIPIMPDEEIQNNVKKVLDNLQIEPHISIIFASKLLYKEIKNYFPNFNSVNYNLPKKRKRGIFKDQNGVIENIYELNYSFHQQLPPDSTTICCISPGIVGCNYNTIPKEIENYPAIAGLFIPKMPEVEVYHFSLADLLDGQVCQVASEGNGIKCLLLFLTNAKSYDLTILKSHVFDSRPFAVGGASIKRCSEPSGSVIVFSGENVNAASIIIEEEDISKEIIENKLKLFKESGLTENHCFALMFSCVGRGYYIHGEDNVESSIFHKLYPKIPLLGIFGEGEFGADFLPHLPRRPKLKQFALSDYRHFYTTVFVLISFNTQTMCHD